MATDTNLVTVLNGEALTTSLVIAKGMHIQHKNAIELIRGYIGDLEEFGEVAFETRLNTQGSPTEVALLNEHQAMLILTYMRNSQMVREFKKRLVKAFFELANGASANMLLLDTIEALQSRVAELEQNAKRLTHKQEVIEQIEMELDAVKRREPNDAATLSAILGKPASQCKAEYDQLVTSGYLTFKDLYTKQRIYEASQKAIEINLIIDKKGKTLLFDEEGLRKALTIQISLF